MANLPVVIQSGVKNKYLLDVYDVAFLEIPEIKVVICISHVFLLLANEELLSLLRIRSDVSWSAKTGSLLVLILLWLGG